ncbi:hypothetical protein BGZ76_003656 [Entomortierella beljakovae]|nr:hypothetical protein BGZ76_003656 [Entomortierella beljakovae]
MSSADPLADQINPIVLRAQQKAIPYIRDLIPGKEDSRLNTSQSQTTTPNISRDLQIVVEEATGRLRTNRTSHDPWLYYTPSYDEMPLSSARHRKESKYWVFRDQDGLIPGPFIFIFGILFPILWWIGCIYPILEHPDNVPETAQSAADTQSNYNSDNNRWLEPLFKFFKNIIPRRSPSAAMVSQEFSRRSQETDREGSTIAPPTQVNINAIPLPIQAPSLDSRGPWSAEENASSALFEQRIEYDRKVQRYNVTQRWKRIHLALSIGTFVIAIIITSFTMSFKH